MVGFIFRYLVIISRGNYLSCCTSPHCAVTNVCANRYTLTLFNNWYRLTDWCRLQGDDDLGSFPYSPLSQSEFGLTVRPWVKSPEPIGFRLPSNNWVCGPCGCGLCILDDRRFCQGSQCVWCGREHLSLSIPLSPSSALQSVLLPAGAVNWTAHPIVVISVLPRRPTRGSHLVAREQTYV